MEPSNEKKCVIVDMSNIDEELSFGPEEESELRSQLKNELMQKGGLNEEKGNRWIELVVSVSKTPYNTPRNQIVKELKEKFPYLKHSR